MSRYIKLNNDRGLTRAAPHHPRFSTGTQRQAERIQQDGLSGAGFSGQHAQPLAEGNIRLVDEHKILDKQTR